MTKCCDINAGMLRTAITVQRTTRTSDGAGGYTDARSAISGAPRRASVKFKSGNERQLAERIDAVAGYKVTMRYFSGLQERDRIVIKGRTHNIRAIDNVEMRDKWLVVHTELGPPV